jgi:hypothetical protein
VLFAVVSTGRPHAVAHYPGFTFYVPPEDEDAYREAGAKVRVAVGLSGARNAAMDDAFASDTAVAILSDDLVSLRSPYAEPPERADLATRVMQTAEAMEEAIFGTRMFLAGIPSHANPYWARGGTGLTTHTWVDGDFQVIRANPLVRYDETLPLHETVDFALEHLHTFGAVARFDRVLAKFTHRTNPGGCQAARAARPELDAECEARMRAKWSCCLTYSPGSYDPSAPSNPTPIVRFRRAHG